MKIAYFINEYPKVSHSFIRREIAALERQGLQVLRVALRGWEGSLPDNADCREREKTLYVLRKGIWALLPFTLRALFRSPRRFLDALRLTLKMAHVSDRGSLRHIAYLMEACRIAPWVKDFEARRIHAHFGTNSTDVVMLLNALGGPPYSFTVHGPEEFLRPIGLREKIRRADFVVAISSFGRSQLSLWADGRSKSKIRIIHCGLEQGFYEGVRQETYESRRLICVGRLVAEKGQMLLVEAAGRLAAKGLAFELVLAGDGPDRQEIEDFVRLKGLTNTVRVTGWISSEQVREEILRARALVLPSFAEGLPVVIMEAMALSRPVLSTYVAGIPELVRDGETGWLFPASSLDDLTAAIEDCLSKSSEEIQTMGARGRLRAISRHRIDNEVERLAALFRAAPVAVDERV